MAITAIHPGEHLAEELTELEMSAAELARQLEVRTNRITEILKGHPSEKKGCDEWQPPK
jgi:antitoxin HigA-1